MTNSDRLGAINPKLSPIRNAINLLCKPSCDPAINKPLSDDAAVLLEDLVGGSTKLTREVMDKRSHAINELVRLGCIRLDVRNRDEKIGITPGSVITQKVIALADEFLARIEEWRLQQ